MIKLTKLLSEEAAIPIRPLSNVERYLQMSPEEFSKLSKDEVSTLLNEVLPELDVLDEKVKKLEWIFDQVKENKLLKELRKFKENTLRYQNVLVTLIESSYTNQGKIIKRLEEESPKIKALIAKLRAEETSTVEKVRKAYSKDRMRPKGYPDRPEKVMAEGILSKGKELIVRGWNKIREILSSIWLGTLNNLNDDIKEMTLHLDRKYLAERK